MFNAQFSVHATDIQASVSGALAAKQIDHKKSVKSQPNQKHKVEKKSDIFNIKSVNAANNLCTNKQITGNDLDAVLLYQHAEKTAIEGESIYQEFENLTKKITEESEKSNGHSVPIFIQFSEVSNFEVEQHRKTHSGSMIIIPSGKRPSFRSDLRINHSPEHAFSTKQTEVATGELSIIGRAVYFNRLLNSSFSEFDQKSKSRLCLSMIQEAAETQHSHSYSEFVFGDSRISKYVRTDNKNSDSNVTIVGWEALSEYISGFTDDAQFVALNSIKAAFQVLGFDDFPVDSGLAQTIRKLIEDDKNQGQDRIN